MDRWIAQIMPPIDASCMSRGTSSSVVYGLKDSSKPGVAASKRGRHKLLGLQIQLTLARVRY